MTDANAPGWYADPAGIHHQRYWEGDAWTPRVADAYGVTAVHHLDGYYTSPSGDAVLVSVADKAPTPSLSLVAPAAAPPDEIDLRVEEPEAVVVVPEPVVLESAPFEPGPAGWYPDPSGIHRERAWDGSTWGGVVMDRNLAVREHALRDAFPAPDRAGWRPD